MIALNAKTAVQIARQLGISGAVLKKFKNGQELREYNITINGETWSGKIRALPCDHA